ncbi:tryptophan 7-halogenase [Sphingomonas sp. LT1P40]|uniref:tryptophan 7-halogenase n=1 Tax=Alteristakelama amylovorans TaxID=3096166 RepID=UPI002FCBE207
MSAAFALTRSVLVIGDGIVGIAAAIAMRRALPGAAVTLLQLPPNPDGWINRLGAAGPVIHKFHRQIGLDPRLFVQRAGAQPVHLRRYVGPGQPDLREACTAAIPFVEGVPLHHIWLRHGASTGEAKPDFAAMLLALRDAHGDEGGFGVRFHAPAYADLLADMAAALNIVRCDSADIQVEADGERIDGVTTSDATLTADLYIDAAGPRSRLLTALGTEWCDWATSLTPRALTIVPEGAGAPGEETLTTASSCLHWQTPLWRATVIPASGPATGRLHHSAQANAVAIGEAAVHAPVADGMLLGTALEDILRLITLLPRPGGDDRDSSEYVRRTAIAHDALADWSGLCFMADGAPCPDSLAAILAAFDARGRIAPRELDPITPGAWLARLMALRPPPRRIDPTALALPEEIVRMTIARAAESGVTTTPR